jgi:PPOX class probable F420-dependent enzyme
MHSRHLPELWSKQLSLRLSSEEAWDFLGSAHTGILTTLRADGSPITLPIWFVVLDGGICFSTPVRTKKVARIRHDPRASFLVEAGERWSELTGVHLTGLIERIDDAPTQAQVETAFDDKYAGLRAPKADLPPSAREGPSRYYFRLVPAARILSWDNSKNIQ